MVDRAETTSKNIRGALLAYNFADNGDGTATVGGEDDEAPRL
jgi:hypothetical protein